MCAARVAVTAADMTSENAGPALGSPWCTPSAAVTRSVFVGSVVLAYSTTVGAPYMNLVCAA